MLLGLMFMFIQGICKWFLQFSYFITPSYIKWKFQELVTKKVQSKHEWLQKHQTNIQPPATHYEGEFHNQFLHSPRIRHKLYLEESSHTFCLNCCWTVATDFILWDANMQNTFSGLDVNLPCCLAGRKHSWMLTHA